MIIKHTRNVFHLAITESTALRVVLHVAKDKIEWYNDNDLHNQVLKALYPVILDTILKEQEENKKQLDSNQHTIHKEGFRILYRFTLRSTHQTLIKTSKDFKFINDDEKPILETTYQSITTLPFQLIISIDDQLLNDNQPTILDSYLLSTV